MPPLLKVLYVQHAVTSADASAAVPGPHEAGKFLDLLSREISAALRGNTSLAVFCIEPAHMAADEVPADEVPRCELAASSA